MSIEITTLTEQQKEGIRDGIEAPQSSETPSLTGVETITNKTLGVGTIISLGSDSPGDIYFRNDSNVLDRLPVGSDEQMLSLSGTRPIWVDTSSLMPGLSDYARTDHNHVSADITDATPAATPNTIVLRGDNGEVEFGKATGFSGFGITGETGDGTGVVGGASGTGGIGVAAYSNLGTALFAESHSGTYHAEFSNNAVIFRNGGLFGWIRSGGIQTIGAASELADHRAITLPDRDGTVVVSDTDDEAGESAITNIVSLIEDDYTALENKDESTLYIIKPNPEP